MATTQQTFPGVYTSIVDRSTFQTISSRLRTGLIGVAQKGPFDTPVSIRSSREFVDVFGQSLDGSYLANAATILGDMSDGTTVVRVGRQYESVASANASGVSGSYAIVTPNAALFSANDYIRITQTGKASTVNAKVDHVSGNTITLVSVGSEAKALAGTYTSANVDRCPVSGAANEAEGFLYSVTYGSAVITGNVVGDKSAYQFKALLADLAAVAVGDKIKISQTGKTSTEEVQVKSVQIDATDATKIVVTLEPANLPEYGYQALALQDSYTAASVYKVTGSTTAPALHALANTSGTWANASGTNGLKVTVSPGSSPNTKRINVYLNSALVEKIDNLSIDPTSDDYYTTRINGNSSYLVVNAAVSPLTAPANTLDPWNTSVATPLNVCTFSSGYNGESASAADFVGTILPADDSATGLKCFEDTDNLFVNIICAPGITYMSVHQEIARIGAVINARGIGDIPQGLNSREATDWHNGTGLYSTRGKLDTPYMTYYWNWITVIDPFTGAEKVVPPTVGALRVLAYTFDSAKPWFAAAGETRGLIPEAVQVEFPKISLDAKSAMYGNGNSVNPILLNRGRIMVFGERTLQRTESKLTALHSCILVDYVVNGLAQIGRHYVFEPNDPELLNQLRSSFQQFLQSVQAERGIEDYNLVIDDTNNTAATRNNREVHVDLYIIPTDTMERLYINATVRESGAQLNTATTA